MTPNIISVLEFEGENYLLHVGLDVLPDAIEIIECEDERYAEIALKYLKTYYGVHGNVSIQTKEDLLDVESIKCPDCGISNTVDFWDSHSMQEMGIKSKQRFTSASSTIKALAEQQAMFHCPMCNEELEGVNLIREYNGEDNSDGKIESYRIGDFLMNKPKAYGSFVKRGDYVFRTSAYIQWGDSETSIGACLLLNPGSATLDNELIFELETKGSVSGWVKTEDPTMQQLISIVEGVYEKDKPITGRFHIYNLFNLQNTKSQNAVDEFELLVQTGEYDIAESLASISELKEHPWILLGWGVKRDSRWTKLEHIKKHWRRQIEQSGVPTFGKKHTIRDDYYHPCPLIPTQRPILVDKLVSIYKEKFIVQLSPIPEKSEKGKGQKGSKLLLQNYVNSNQEELNKLILMSSPSLISFIDKELSIDWKSPLMESDYKEYRNEFLEQVDEWKDKRTQLEMYWAKKGPQWDGIAVVEGKNGQKGLLLVEAKAHVHEMRSKIQAKDVRSKAVIESSIMEVKRAMGSQVSLDIWLNQYYQLANRLTYLYVLNEKNGIPTWLILVNFVNDGTHIPTDSLQWIQHYQEIFSQMGISSSSTRLFNQIVTIFPNGR